LPPVRLSGSPRPEAGWEIADGAKRIRVAAVQTGEIADIIELVLEGELT